MSDTTGAGEGEQDYFSKTYERLWWNTMQRLDVVLDILQEKTKVENFKFTNLYRILYNSELYLRAYSRKASNPGNMTPGYDGKTIDGYSLDRINRMIKSLGDESFRPTPTRRTYIKKKNGKMRPLGIPSMDDKIVQEAVRVILECLYEPTFSEDSFGYRPGRSCHTAILKIRDRCKSTKWWVEGDIEGFFDNIDHDILINILRKKIKDERFLNLIRKFLRAGYVENWVYHKTFSGAPQGGILSPILSNIYLGELDFFMENLIQKFNKGDARGHSNAWGSANFQVKKYRKYYAACTDRKEKKTILGKIRKSELIQRSMSSKDDMDAGFRRLKYFRYADDFIISVIGNKEDAAELKQKIKQFLKEELKLNLSEEKTFITHNSKPIRFLGYEIEIARSNAGIPTKRGLVKQLNGNVILRMPHDRVREFLLKNGYMSIGQDGSWRARHNKPLTNLDELEIIRSYNATIRGFYNYYQLAHNIFNFHHPYFIIHQSFQKTLANKYRTSASEIRRKYSIDGALAVTYKNSKGKLKINKLFNGPFKRSEKAFVDVDVDQIPNKLIYTGRGSLMARLAADTCEWCGTSGVELEMHHVRKLKGLKGKELWERVMIARQRKTIALCRNCHVDLHKGTLRQYVGC
ncbi:group II intron reverse transcriptase/maturase [Paenibacillus sp. PastF-3]|uniref:reverse transcriptase/maturase family protein n=1 Tax=Paenibacillus sp. PastF-3 TaxID=2940626 RepID=UPI002477290C|nr:reverse transcriptase/maturase family protein [Paenibacillus sp. PastF-3]MDH6373780.1 group II intron reverse transcriptase/maturase [Paenibacillus sp. PastF-3]